MSKKSARTKRNASVDAPSAPVVTESRALVPQLERDERRGFLTVLVLTFLALVPFIGKAIHIDDPLFVWAAQKIADDPFDPYGFSVNWFGRLAPMKAVMQNPPLTSYFLAIPGSMFGWSDAGLHLMSVFFGLALMAGCWFLARRFVNSPALAAILTLAMPVVMVSSTNLMSDVPMTACFVWALALWMRGVDTGANGFLWSAAPLAGAAGLFKYFGIAVVLLMLAYLLMSRRNVGKGAVALLLPVAIWTAYHFATQAAYGESLLFAAMHYASSQKSQEGTTLLLQVVRGLSFTGGSVLPLLIASPLLASKKRWWAMPVIVFLALVGAIGTAASLKLSGAPWAIVQLAAFVAAGVGLFVLAVLEIRRRRDAAAVVLLLWIAGTFVFAVYFNWTVAGRSLLPLAPAAAILLVSNLEITNPSRKALVAVLGVSALFAFGVTMSDYQLAGAGRTAAREITSKYAADGHTIWFEGHWGFQYYMQRGGAYPYDVNETVHKNDLWMVPSNNTSPVLNKPPHRVVEELRESIAVPFSTMNRESNAGFYSDFAGPLPFYVGLAPDERYSILRLGR